MHTLEESQRRHWGVHAERDRSSARGSPERDHRKL